MFEVKLTPEEMLEIERQMDADEALYESQISQVLEEFGVESIDEVTALDACDMIASMSSGWPAYLASYVYFRTIDRISEGK